MQLDPSHWKTLLRVLAALAADDLGAAREAVAGLVAHRARVWLYLIAQYDPQSPERVPVSNTLPDDHIAATKNLLERQGYTVGSDTDGYTVTNKGGLLRRFFCWQDVENFAERLIYTCEPPQITLHSNELLVARALAEHYDADRLANLIQALFLRLPLQVQERLREVVLKEKGDNHAG